MDNDHFMQVANAVNQEYMKASMRRLMLTTSTTASGRPSATGWECDHGRPHVTTASTDIGAHCGADFTRTGNRRFVGGAFSSVGPRDGPEARFVSSACWIIHESSERCG
jgi:hypothetical protein